MKSADCRRETMNTVSEWWKGIGLQLKLQLLIHPAVAGVDDDFPSRVENANGYMLDEASVAWFMAAYAPDGNWAKLFRSSPEYLGPELLRDAYISGSYLTIDRWKSEYDFRTFRKEHDQDYEVLDRQCDSLTSRETRIGAYAV